MLGAMCEVTDTLAENIFCRLESVSGTRLPTYVMLFLLWAMKSGSDVYLEGFDAMKPTRFFLAERAAQTSFMSGTSVDN